MEYVEIKFNQHLQAAFNNLSYLRDNQIYTDLTLSCNGRFYPAHRLVVSSCCEYIARSLQTVPSYCPHPVILLDGLTENILSALLSFMYDGAVTVHKDDVPKLMESGQKLGVRGLVKETNEKISTDNQEQRSPNINPIEDGVSSPLNEVTTIQPPKLPEPTNNNKEIEKSEILKRRILRRTPSIELSRINEPIKRKDLPLEIQKSTKDVSQPMKKQKIEDISSIPGKRDSVGSSPNNSKELSKSKQDMLSPKKSLEISDRPKIPLRRDNSSEFPKLGRDRSFQLLSFSAPKKLDRNISSPLTSISPKKSEKIKSSQISTKTETKADKSKKIDKCLSEVSLRGNASPDAGMSVDDESDDISLIDLEENIDVREIASMEESEHESSGFEGWSLRSSPSTSKQHDLTDKTAAGKMKDKLRPTRKIFHSAKASVNPYARPYQRSIKKSQLSTNDKGKSSTMKKFKRMHGTSKMLQKQISSKKNIVVQPLLSGEKRRSALIPSVTQHEYIQSLLSKRVKSPVRSVKNQLNLPITTVDKKESHSSRKGLPKLHSTFLKSVSITQKSSISELVNQGKSLLNKASNIDIDKSDVHTLDSPAREQTDNSSANSSTNKKNPTEDNLESSEITNYNPQSGHSAVLKSQTGNIIAVLPRGNTIQKIIQSSSGNDPSADAQSAMKSTCSSKRIVKLTPIVPYKGINPLTKFTIPKDSETGSSATVIQKTAKDVGEQIDPKSSDAITINLPKISLVMKPVKESAGDSPVKLDPTPSSKKRKNSHPEKSCGERSLVSSHETTGSPFKLNKDTTVIDLTDSKKDISCIIGTSSHTIFSTPESSKRQASTSVVSINRTIFNTTLSKTNLSQDQTKNPIQASGGMLSSPLITKSVFMASPSDCLMSPPKMPGYISIRSNSDLCKEQSDASHVTKNSDEQLSDISIKSNVSEATRTNLNLSADINLESNFSPVITNVMSLAKISSDPVESSTTSVSSSFEPMEISESNSNSSTHNISSSESVSICTNSPKSIVKLSSETLGNSCESDPGSFKLAVASNSDSKVSSHTHTDDTKSLEIKGPSLSETSICNPSETSIESSSAAAGSTAFNTMATTSSPIRRAPFSSKITLVDSSPKHSYLKRLKNVASHNKEIHKTNPIISSDTSAYTPSVSISKANVIEVNSVKQSHIVDCTAGTSITPSSSISSSVRSSGDASVISLRKNAPVVSQNSTILVIHSSVNAPVLLSVPGSFASTSKNPLLLSNTQSKISLATSSAPVSLSTLNKSVYHPIISNPPVSLASTISTSVSLQSTNDTPISLSTSKTPFSVPSTSKTPVSVPSTSKTPVSVPSTSKTPVSVPSTSKTPVSVPNTSKTFVSVPNTRETSVNVPSTSKTPASVQSTSKTPASVQSIRKTPVSVTSKTPVSVQSTSKTPVSVQSTSKTPVSVQSTSKTPVSVQSTSKTPVSVQSTSKTPVSVQSTSKTPASVQSIFKTPVSVQSISKTPVSVQSISKTPVSVQSISKTPVSVQSISKTPVSVQSISKAPVSVQSTSKTPVSVPSTSMAPVSVPSTSMAPVSVPSTSNTPASLLITRKTSFSLQSTSNTPVFLRNTSRPLISVPRISGPLISLPSTSSTPVSLPSTSSTPVSLPSTSSTPVSLPSTSSTPVSLPSTSSTPVSLPSTSSTPVSLPSTSSTPVSLPSTISTPISRPSTISTPISRPSTSSTHVSLPSTSSTHVSFPSTSNKHVSFPSTSNTPVSLSKSANISFQTVISKLSPLEKGSPVNIKTAKVSASKHSDTPRLGGRSQRTLLCKICKKSFKEASELFQHSKQHE